MPRYAAFLRAINVGRGRTVRMEDLRRLFEGLGFSNVVTFLASGNVVSETESSNAAALERKIERRLRDALGFAVDTFIRTDDEMAEIAAFAPFPRSKLKSAAEVNVVLLKERLDETAARRVSGLRTATDEFQARGREVYWLRRKKAPGLYSTVPLEKTLGVPFTVRATRTIRQMTGKPGT